VLRTRGRLDVGGRSGVLNPARETCLKSLRPAKSLENRPRC
jgi:hypothetical protein